MQFSICCKWSQNPRNENIEVNICFSLHTKALLSVFQINLVVDIDFFVLFPAPVVSTNKKMTTPIQSTLRQKLFLQMNSEPETSAIVGKFSLNSKPTANRKKDKLMRTLGCQAMTQPVNNAGSAHSLNLAAHAALKAVHIPTL